jgi:heme-degrading monooxygenase HmoA
MYVLFTVFTLGPETREIADKLGEKFSSILTGLKGFKRLTMFRDDETGENGGLSLWESKEDAEAALATTGSELKEALSGVVKGPPKRGVYEVWRISEAN